MPWYAYALTTPFFYSISNYLDKFLIEKKIKNPFAMTVVSGFASGILGLVVWAAAGFKWIGLFPAGMMLVAGFLLIFYLLPYFAALKAEDASTIVPMFQFIPVFTLILSSLILQEALSKKQIIGLILVVAAAILISMQKLKGNVFRPRKALLYMLLASMLYGSVGILFRFVVKGVDFWTTFAYEYMGTGVGATLLFIFMPGIRKSLRREGRMITASLGIIVFNNVICILAQLAESYAVSMVAVPLVNIVGSIQPLIVFLEGIILTRFFPHVLKENISREILVLKLFSIIFMLFGLFLVYG